MSASTISANGSVMRQVTCESCGHCYDYELSRTAYGSFSGFAVTRAKADEFAARDAAHNLEMMLATECDVAPCPRCGALTRRMQEEQAKFVPTCLGGLVLGSAIVGLVYLVGIYTDRWFYVMGLIGLVLALASFFLLLGAIWNWITRFGRRKTPTLKSPGQRPVEPPRPSTLNRPVP